MVWLARGLAFMLAGFIGGVASVALGLLSRGVSLQDRYLLGLPLAGALLWIGVACLRRVTTPGRAWCSATHVCFRLAMGVFFFSPFVFLASRAPEVDYLMFNLLFFSVACAGLICFANRMVFRLAEFHDDRRMAMWARGSEGFSYAAMLVAAGAFAAATWIVSTEEGMQVEGAVELFWGDFWPWLLRLCLAPVCTTVVLLWALKSVTLARFQALARTGESAQERNRTRAG